MKEKVVKKFIIASTAFCVLGTLGFFIIRNSSDTGLETIKTGKIYYPGVYEEVSNNITDNSLQNDESTAKININSATWEDLDELPGIGETLAKRIVNYRQKNGNFDSIDDLMDVAGIGEKRFNEVKDMITV